MSIGEEPPALLLEMLDQLNLTPLARSGEERDRLQRLLNRVRATLRDAEQMEIRRESTTLWLWDLKKLADDVEDVLDDFEYEDLRCRVEAATAAAAEGGYHLGSGDGSGSSTDLSSIQYDVMTSKIADIWRRFDEIAKGRDVLDLSLEPDHGADQMHPNTQVRETSSFLTVPQVLGRDGEKEEIIQYLVEPPAEGLSVLATVGIGGVGKTTLAQFVYNDDRVRDYFHARIWVHVSCDFDVKGVLRQIIQQVTDPRLLLHQMDNLNALQMTVADSLRDKCFLLVLDDMWYKEGIICNLESWEAIYAPLISGGKGSKILVTTRSAQVLFGVRQPVKTIELGGLEFEYSWSLFVKHAFLDGNSEQKANLQCMGKKIVEKLNGVPLAIVAIGGLLCSKSEESEWAHVLESELWELEEAESGILPALRLSYEHLPQHLKPCFAFFSIYFKGEGFDELELLQVWMALGYIQSQGRKRMEDVARDYLNCLVSRSLVQFVNGWYSVHDLLHDLGRHILRRDCCAIETDQLDKISVEDQCQHHLSLFLHRQLNLTEWERLQDFRKVRTLAFVFDYKSILDIPSSLFKNMSYLRVLDLSGGIIHTIPDSIGNLRHLRYLDLRRTHIRYLPESLCSLYMLQALKLQGCEQLGILPKGMSNLINLRHLEAKYELVSGISGLGRLTHLQQLDIFSISEGDGIKIEDLRNMNELQGMLHIQNLQRVGSREEASQANLSNKKYINKLVLEWIENGDVNQSTCAVEEEVLDVLVPPPNLKELAIKGYAGTKFPSWMKHHLSDSGLEALSLDRCQRWDALPALIQRLSSLRALGITFCPQLKKLPSLPTTLINLRLQGVGLSALSGLERLYLLQELILSNIPNLREVPSLPTTLRKLTLHNLGLETLPELYQVQDEATGEGVDKNSSLLCEINIVDCQNLRTLRGVFRQKLPDLRVLSIKGCQKLEHWPVDEEFQATLHSLRDEWILVNCPKLSALPEGSIISPSLKKLIVTGCPNFPDRTFFIQLQNLKNLTQARVHVEKRYQDMASCSDEALQQIGAVDDLLIAFNYCNGGGVSFVYDTSRHRKPRSTEFIRTCQVSLKICGGNNHGHEDYSCSRVLSTWLRQDHICCPLRRLGISNMPHGASSFTPHLPSLTELVITGYRDMKRLPVETLLCHLKQLKNLLLFYCPEVTLPAVEEAIKSLPSLELLYTFRCPRVSLRMPNPPAHVSESEKLVRVEESSSSSGWNCSPPRLLRFLRTDDAGLLCDGQFAHDHLTSLEELEIDESDVDFFSAAEGDYRLRSLRTLRLSKCPNLEGLPSDLGSRFPSLEALLIAECPRLRCVPERGLPASLQVLSIAGSPGLEQEDWLKVARVRSILIDGQLVHGSFHDYEELVARGTIPPLTPCLIHGWARG